MEEDKQNQAGGEEKDLSSSTGLGNLVLDDADDSNKNDGDDDGDVNDQKNDGDDELKLPEDIEFDDEDWKAPPPQRQEEEPDFSHFTALVDLILDEDDSDNIPAENEEDDHQDFPDVMYSDDYADESKLPEQTELAVSDRRMIPPQVAAAVEGLALMPPMGSQDFSHLSIGGDYDELLEDIYQSIVSTRPNLLPGSSSQNLDYMGSYDPILGMGGFPVLDIESRQIQEAIHHSLNPSSSRNHSVHEYGESSNSQESSSVYDDDVFEDDSDMIQCPFPNCAALFMDDGEGYLIRACPECWKIFCTKCRVRWHMGSKCHDFMLRKLAMRILMRPERIAKSRFKGKRNTKRELKKSMLGRK